MPEPPPQELLDLQQAVLGRYSIDREIGRGGMGIVYLVRDVALDRPVALKLLPPVMASEPHLRQRFLSEARTSAKLSHPNIIPIHSVEEIDEFVFFSMAFVNGRTLGKVLREKGALTPGEASRVLREVAWALAYAHAQGVVHRDVKPDNILLENETGRVLVADFGIARAVEEEGLTGAGEILGTAEYMSPEQAGGEGVDGRSDIYSLGVVGFYMLSGRLPFEGATIREVLNKHLNEPPPPLSSVAPSVPGRLARTIDTCLAKDKSLRPENAEALAETIASVAVLRAELPVPLRVFLKRLEVAGRNSRGLSGVVALFALPAAIGAVANGDPLIGLAVLAGSVGVALGVSGSMLSWHFRYLMRNGYGQRDLIPVLGVDLDRHLEEYAFQYGYDAGIVEKSTRYLALGAGGVGALSILAAFIVPGAQEVLLGIGVLGVMLGAVSGMLSIDRYGKRTQWFRKIRNKLLSGKPGNWIFKIAGIGLKRKALSPTVTHRPTEIAIGLAVDHLLADLPRETRKEMAELPKVVRKLELDAQEIRKRIDELDEMLGQMHGVRAPSSGQLNLSGGVREIVRKLTETRENAQQRLMATVATLETIRLDLLRLKSGAGAVDSLTEDLEAAIELQSDIGRLIDGQREVEALVRSHLTNPAINVEV